MSSETHPIKVTNLDSEKIRAKEIANENSKTGKVTAVVAVMYLSKDKLCNSWSAKRKLLAKDHQISKSKIEKSKCLARIRQKVALRDDLEKGRGKASQTGTSESYDDISTCLKVETKTIRVLLDTGASGDLLFMQKGGNRHSYCEEHRSKGRDQDNKGPTRHRVKWRPPFYAERGKSTFLL